MLRALLEQGLQSIIDATTAIMAWWAANSLRHHAVIVPSDVHRGTWHSPDCCCNNTVPAYCVASIRLQHAKLLHAVAQDVTSDTQELSGPNLIVFGEIQGLADETIFDAVIGLTSMRQEDLF
jgi:hypothetical protein